MYGYSYFQEVSLLKKCRNFPAFSFFTNNQRFSFRYWSSVYPVIFWIDFENKISLRKADSEDSEEE